MADIVSYNVLLKLALCFTFLIFSTQGITEELNDDSVTCNCDKVKCEPIDYNKCKSFKGKLYFTSLFKCVCCPYCLIERSKPLHDKLI